MRVLALSLALVALVTVTAIAGTPGICAYAVAMKALEPVLSIVLDHA
jgi:hypothetical protein